MKKILGIIMMTAMILAACGGEEKKSYDNIQDELAAYGENNFVGADVTSAEEKNGELFVTIKRDIEKYDNVDHSIVTDDTAKLVKDFIDRYDAIHVRTMDIGHDAKGKETEEMAASISVSKETAKEIDWENFNPQNFITVADEYKDNGKFTYE
ncbi:hypothetical protein [Pseudobacillus badius]|uniref:hypothetical protein n=1 Tax=Bacillus badius TaxID=1455 RepID=UPI0007B37002|nr:hypothetical protein [Bacillus badius]KZR60375.1 hypothetical protein A3781_09380 [Bacillus badius]